MKGDFESYESWNLSLEFQFSFFNSHFSILIVPWCNGSTSDFGSACPGSNPGGTTENASNEAFFVLFLPVHFSSNMPVKIQVIRHSSFIICNYFIPLPAK